MDSFNESKVGRYKYIWKKETGNEVVVQWFVENSN